MTYDLTDQSVYGISDLFRIYILFRFMEYRFPDKKVSSKLMIIFYALYFLLTTHFHIIYHEIFIDLLINITLFYLITFLYKTSIPIRISTTAIAGAASVAWDGVFLALSSVLQYWFYALYEAESILLTSCAAAALMIFLSMRIMKYLKENYKQLTPGMLPVLAVPICSIIIGAIAVKSGQFEKQPAMNLLICSILLLMNVIVFVVWDLIGKNNENRKTQTILQSQNEAYVHQIQLMEQAQQQIRFLRHDMKNHFSQIRILAREHDTDRILAYLADAEQYADTTRVSVESGDPEIDSIVDLKLTEARALGITVHTEIKVPQGMDLSGFDMNIILGNLLDNALNALKNCTKKRLYLKIQYDAGILYIVVKNDFAEQSEKNSPESGHGLGLLSVRNTAEQYSGRLVCSKKDNVFTAKVMLYL